LSLDFFTPCTFSPSFCQTCWDSVWKSRGSSSSAN